MKQGCNCECHTPGLVMFHCMPCCSECPDCGINVPTMAFGPYCDKGGCKAGISMAGALKSSPIFQEPRP